MSERRNAARWRTAIATTLSVAGHAVVVLMIALDLDRGSEEPAFAPTVEITLTPLDLRPERPRPPPPTSRSVSPPPTSPPRPRRIVPAGSLPSAPAAPYYAPAAPSPAPPAGPATEDLPTALRTGCIGKRGLEAEARVDCKLEIWSVLDGKPARDLPGDTIPKDKKAAYDLVARRQAAQRRPIAELGNGDSMGCAQANLGTGCLDDMLIPLTGSQARERRSGGPAN